MKVSTIEFILFIQQKNNFQFQFMHNIKNIIKNTTLMILSVEHNSSVNLQK